MIGYTVAVKHANESVQFCGFYDSEVEAQKNARHLRESWKDCILTPPTSIRVRKVTNDEFWKNQRR